MDKSEILADLRQQFGPGSYLYAKDIAVILNKPTVASVYEAMKRKGGLPWPMVKVGKRPAVSIYAVVATMAGEDAPVATKSKAPEPGKPALPLPKHKINKNLTKALSLLRAQQNFIDEVCSEIDVLILQDEIPVKPEPVVKLPIKPRNSNRKRV